MVWCAALRARRCLRSASSDSNALGFESSGGGKPSTLLPGKEAVGELEAMVEAARAASKDGGSAALSAQQPRARSLEAALETAAKEEPGDPSP